MKTKSGLLGYSVMLLTVILTLAVCFVFNAQAAELNYAGPALKFAAAYDDTFSAGVVPGSIPGDLPSAYLFYSKDGSAFAIGRWFDGSLEDYSVDVPANSSLMIPAPSPIMIGERWSHVFRLDASAATDSVIVVPFSR